MTRTTRSRNGGRTAAVLNARYAPDEAARPHQ